jgi:hypothetical protein
VLNGERRCISVSPGWIDERPVESEAPEEHDARGPRA